MMGIEVWLLVGASLLTVELFLRSGLLSRCLALVAIMRRAQRALVRRGVTEDRKERAVTALWLYTMKRTAVLALTIAAVFLPLALLYLVDLRFNMRVFALLDWSSSHLAFMFATIVYALVRRQYGR